MFEATDHRRNNDRRGKGHARYKLLLQHACHDQRIFFQYSQLFTHLFPNLYVDRLQLQLDPIFKKRYRHCPFNNTRWSQLPPLVVSWGADDPSSLTTSIVGAGAPPFVSLPLWWSWGTDGPRRQCLDVWGQSRHDTTRHDTKTCKL